MFVFCLVSKLTKKDYFFAIFTKNVALFTIFQQNLYISNVFHSLYLQYFAYFVPGSDAVAKFPYVPGSTLYSYCNKHGLWKTDVV